MMFSLHYFSASGADIGPVFANHIVSVIISDEQLLITRSTLFLIKDRVSNTSTIERLRFKDEDDNTKQCSRVKQRHFGGKTWQPSSVCYYEFWQECCSGGNKLSNVRSFIIFLSEEGLISFSINNRTNFFTEKKLNEAFRGVFFRRTRAKPLS